MFYADKCVSNDKVLKLINKLKELKTELHQFSLCKDGKILVDISPEPYSPFDKRLVYSVSKSFTSTAVGLCFDKGLIDLKKKIAEYFPDKVTEKTDKRILCLTVHDLLIMHTRIKDIMPELHNESDPVKAFFSQAPEDVTDEYHYSNSATFMLSALVNKVSGLSVIDLLNRDFFPYIGVSRCWWQDIEGISEGYSGFHVSARDIALTMQVYLNNGMFSGKRLLSEEWVRLATSCHISTENDNKFEWWTKGYGYQFWMNKGDGCRAVGSCGQNGYIFPSLGVTAGEEGIIKKIDETDDAYREFCADFEGESTVKAEDIEKALKDWYLPYDATASEFKGIDKTYDFSESGLPFDKLSLKDMGEFTLCTLTAGEEITNFCLGNGNWQENKPEFYNFNSKLVVFTVPKKEKIHFAACLKADDENKLCAFFRFLDCPLRHEISLTVDGDNAKLRFKALDVSVDKEFSGRII